jgi:hypothetical protein
VQVARDPGSAGRPGVGLERVQLIKLWLGPDGRYRERVVDVALGAEGAPLDTESCHPPAGGSQRLCAVWPDPDFDARQPALYYARALELPTCRWSTRACNAAGVDCRRPHTVGAGFEPCCDPDYPRATRERAWASPIWYQPVPAGPPTSDQRADGPLVGPLSGPGTRASLATIGTPDRWSGVGPRCAPFSAGYPGAERLAGLD